MADIDTKKVIEKEITLKNDDNLDTENVSLYILNLEDSMEYDLESGNGFVITDKKGLQKSKDKKSKKKKGIKNKDNKEFNKTIRTENGIYSPKFGSIFGDDNAFEEAYSCECGELMGKFYKGELCHNCGTTVRYKDKNVNMTGWFYLNNYKLIHPQMLEFLKSLIGSKTLDRILDSEWESNDDGIPIKPEIKDTKNVGKYDNIGFLEFQERFEEICEFFLSKNKAKKDIFDFIIKHKDATFTSALPVYALFLRPLALSDEDLDYLPINRKYASLSTKMFNLNNKYEILTDRNEKIINKTLFSAQQKYSEISKMVMDSLIKKNGHIRNNILGSRYNHTGRFVITPFSKHKINEVAFPYLGFLTEFKPEIINVITELYDITISEALNMWTKAYQKFDKRVYDIMSYIVKNYDIRIILNRNPTLNYGSIVRMKVALVKEDYTDLTLGVPINVLGGLAGDFDGDSLNTGSLKDKYLAEAYKLYDPRLEMMISKNDGLFDNNANLIKEQLICLHEFCMIAMDNGARKSRILKVGEIKDGEYVKTKHKMKVSKKEPKTIRKIKIKRRV